MTKDKKKKPKERETDLTLYPLAPEEAISDLLKVKPPEKKKQTARRGKKGR